MATLAKQDKVGKYKDLQSKGQRGPGWGSEFMHQEHEIEFRVRYQETDAQGRVHHANFITYFEMGRVELLRADGIDYRDLEREGIMLVVQSVQCRYIAAACYDDILRLKTSVTRTTPARVEHAYEVYREDELVAKGSSVLACVDSTGKVRRMPDWIDFKRD